MTCGFTEKTKKASKEVFFVLLGCQIKTVMLVAKLFGVEK